MNFFFYSVRILGFKCNGIDFQKTVFRETHNCIADPCWIHVFLKILSIEGIFLKPLMTSQLQSLKLSKEIINGMLEMGKKYPELSNAILMELGNE